MSELGPVSRSLIDAARGGIGPDSGAAARVRAKVAAAVAGVGVAAAGQSSEAATSGAQAATPVAVPGASSGLVIKLAAAVLVGGAIIGAVIARRPSAPAVTAGMNVHSATTSPDPASGAAIGVPVDPRDELASADVRVAASDAVSGAPRPAAGRPSPGRPESGPPESGSPGRPDPGPAASPASPASPASGQASGAAIDLGREVELVDRASAAEREGRYDDALEAIRIYAQEIGDRGQLAEEAAAIDIEVTCRKRGAFADKLAAFDRKWPSSAQRARLAAACHTN